MRLLIFCLLTCNNQVSFWFQVLNEKRCNIKKNLHLQKCNVINVTMFTTIKYID